MRTAAYRRNQDCWPGRRQVLRGRRDRELLELLLGLCELILKSEALLPELLHGRLCFVALCDCLLVLLLRRLGLGPGWLRCSVGGPELIQLPVGRARSSGL